MWLFRRYQFARENCPGPGFEHLRLSYVKGLQRRALVDRLLASQLEFLGERMCHHRTASIIAHT